MPLAEGQAGEFANVGGVPYTAVTSCLTVTCKIAGVTDTYVGGHLSLQVPSGRLDSSQVLPEMKRLINGRPVQRVHLAGVLDGWSDEYFNLPLYTGAGAAAVLNYDSAPDVTPAGSLASMALSRLIDVPDDENFDFNTLPPATHETKRDQFTISW
jgi:hypothetical protein